MSEEPTREDPVKFISNTVSGGQLVAMHSSVMTDAIKALINSNNAWHQLVGELSLLALRRELDPSTPIKAGLEVLSHVEEAAKLQSIAEKELEKLAQVMDDVTIKYRTKTA